jgi:shikimate kinase
MTTETIFIVGARASGKTTIGQELARALGCDFVDTDQHMLETTCLTVAQVVEKEGWEGFRRRESEALRAVTRPGLVVATGGGMVLSEANRQFMRDNGTVFYLSAPAAVLAARLEANPEEAQRPTLTGRPIVEEVSEVLAARESLYRDAAHQVLDATAAPDLVVAQALEALRESSSP